MARVETIAPEPRAAAHEPLGELPATNPCAREEDGMKSGLAAIIGLVIMTFTSTATAYVVEVTTSIPVATAADDARLKDALESAISDVLHHAIAFTPTVVTVHKARVVGGRIYILLLIADEEGEKTIETFATMEPASSEPAEPSREVPPPVSRDSGRW